ncbi:MAG: hypothetical protein KAU01_01130 [Candidatus Cloacimonetes bacterium]|nr:hypothetical protein [Candidatus Cloacimonadota bacterium]
MKKNFISIFVSSFLFISSCSIFTDNDKEKIKFIKTFSTHLGSGISLDITYDNGYIITGYCGDGILLLKTDKKGNEKWCETFGESWVSWGYCVVQTEDDGYIITGNNNLTEHGLYIVKTDTNGEKEWDLTYEGGSGNAVIQTNDGGYIVLGSLSDYPWLIKINRYGFEEWNRIFEYECGGSSIAQTFDEGYIIVGGGLRLIKTDEQGYEVWNSTISDGYGHEVKQTDDGGYIIAGTSEADGGDVWLVKTDALGNREWERTFGGTEFDEGHSVDKTDDGGYIVTGTTRSFIEDSYNIWLIKTNAIGIEEWNKIFVGVSGYEHGEGRCVRQTNDGGYILTGKINNQVCLIKTDDEGNIE